ncbi:hypothetical protein ABTL31_19030, partial [Acinetobacter baumannii]
MNRAASAVRSMKPQPEVCTVSVAVLTLVVRAVDGVERVDLVEVIKAAPLRRPGDRQNDNSNPPRHVLLHAVGHVDQPAPGL